jgi:epoxyqueuosine reductase
MQDNKNRLDSAWIKATAQGLGFSIVGITTPDPPPHVDVYRGWINADRHASMAYLDRPDTIAKRADPLAVLPECQAIVVTGTLCTPAVHDISSDFQVASYAQGEDYHRLLVERLSELVTEMEKQAGKSLQYRIYTDTGPLLERDLAQRAGLGWIGKNTCLIHPTLGSNFLLAELLLDYPLEPDQPFSADRCGSCTRCIDACPTHCILPDRTIDAGRCISYLTIEHKGTIPPTLRPNLGNWIFGCDICQQVCPWNIRFAQHTADQAFMPTPFLQSAALSDFLRLSPNHWRKSLRGSPLERPRRKGLVRNATIVAGNQAREEWIDDLAYVLHNDPEPIPRAHAAWALKQINHPRSREVLSEHLAREQDPEVLHELELD